MREIKFRGMDCSGNWVYGDIIHGVGCKDGKMYILPQVKNLAAIPNCDPLDGVRVNPGTIGQFTGIKAKNGTKIFEGDIITFDGMHEHVVKWIDVRKRVAQLHKTITKQARNAKEWAIREYTARSI